MAIQPRRRATDRGRVVAFKAWLQKWGLLIEGVVLLLVCIGFGIGTWVYAQDRSETDKAASASCQRAKRFGPYLVRQYAVDHTFGRPPIRVGDTEDGLLVQYRQSIPANCP